MSFADDIRAIDLEQLEISDYNRRYLQQLIPSLDYYLDIYRHTLQRIVSATGRSAAETTLVDYGGGHGLMSLTAKRFGIGRVVYVDFNPLSCTTVKALAARLGCGPDAVLCGDSRTLLSWCAEQGVTPDALAGMDVIEHIYRLEPFFDDLFTLNPQISMVFTTGSVPSNPMVRRRLHRVMMADEEGNAGMPGFRAERRQYLEEHFPSMEDKELDEWALRTRGLMFADIESAVARGINAPQDRYNTCDPATGSWTERILNIGEYRRILHPHTEAVAFSNGFYNGLRPGLKGLVAKMLNGLLHLPGSQPIAPFIFIEINTQ